MPRVQIAYLAHDLADPAIGRRMAMLLQGGAGVDLYGFRRTPAPIRQVAGVPAQDLGRTSDGRLLVRLLSVLMACLTVPFWGRRAGGATVVMARNLEMLALAVVVRGLFAPGAALVYELLDVHRLLSMESTAARLLRAFQGLLMKRCSAIIVSSPAFETHHLKKYYSTLPPVLLVENKVMAAAGAAGRPAAAPAAGPPWRIGWFGVLRCRRSLQTLADLARQRPGQVEIDIRGKIAVSIADILDTIVAATPGMTYHGPYRYPDDLPDIYGRVHFAWAIDFYEAGLNSSWLLPNRLYESGYCGTVPIALRQVETGRWLERHGLGVVLDEPLEDALHAFFDRMASDTYVAKAAKIRNAPVALFTDDAETTKTMVRTLSALAGVALEASPALQEAA